MLGPQSTLGDHRPTLFHLGKTWQRVAQLYELSLFKMQAKDKALGLCFLFLKVGKFFGACWKPSLGWPGDFIKPSKNLLGTYCKKKTILEAAEGAQKSKRQRPCLPRAYEDNIQSYFHLKADWEMGLGIWS